MSEPIPQYDSTGRCIGQLMPTISDETLLASPGIQHHSHDAHRPMAIVSAQHKGYSDAINESLHLQLLQRLKGYGLVCGEVNGMYKGTPEKSVLVELRSPDDYDIVLDEAESAGQETVLFISPARDTGLQYIGSPRVDGLGKLQPISYLQAQQLDSWTQTANGQFYGILPPQGE